MNSTLYGFQFAHHGRNTAFWPLARAMKGHVRVIDATPGFNRFLPARIQAGVFHRWMKLNEYRLKASLEQRGRLTHYFFPENTVFRSTDWKHPEHRMVLSCHQPVESDPFQKLMRNSAGFVKGLRAADSIVLMAPNEIEAYRAVAPQAEISYIPLGVSTDFFDCKNVGAIESRNSKKILTVGGWLRDFQLWAEVIRHVFRKDPEICFTLISGASAQCAALSQFDGEMPANVKFLSGIPDSDLRRKYASHDLMFLPLVDAWANTALLESASMGLPVFASDLPAVREYLGDDALCFENRDPASVADSLLTILDDQTRLKEVSANLRRRIVEKFDWAHIAGQYVALYERLLGS